MSTPNLAGAGADSRPMDAAAELSALLWRERELIDDLAFRMTVEQTMLLTGRHRWLPQATAEVEESAAHLAGCQAARAESATRLGAALGIAGPVTLGRLAAAVPAPWDALLAEHRRALGAATAELSELTAVNRQLLARRISAVSSALGLLGQAPADYTRSGTAPPPRFVSAAL